MKAVQVTTEVLARIRSVEAFRIVSLNRVKVDEGETIKCTASSGSCQAKASAVVHSNGKTWMNVERGS